LILDLKENNSGNDALRAPLPFFFKSKI